MKHSLKRTLTGHQPSGTGGISVKMNHRAERTLFPAAWAHAVMAVGAHFSGDDQHQPLEISESLQAVIMSAASFESYSNGLGIHLFGQNKWVKGNRQRRGILDIWKEINDKQSALDLRAEPYQGVQRTFKSRNYAMHYQPLMLTPVASMHGNGSKLGAVFTFEAGIDAVVAVRDAIRLTSHIADQPVAWLDEFEEKQFDIS
jgi:hypothetical protein